MKGRGGGGGGAGKLNKHIDLTVVSQPLKSRVPGMCESEFPPSSCFSPFAFSDCSSVF